MIPLNHWQKLLSFSRNTAAAKIIPATEQEACPRADERAILLGSMAESSDTSGAALVGSVLKVRS